MEDLGILASPNDEETTEKVESVRKDTSGSMMHVSAKASFAKKMGPVEENTEEERENEYPKKHPDTPRYVRSGDWCIRS